MKRLKLGEQLVEDTLPKGLDNFHHRQRVLPAIVKQRLLYPLTLGFAAITADKRFPSQPGSLSVPTSI